MKSILVFGFEFETKSCEWVTLATIYSDINQVQKIRLGGNVT